MTDEQSQELTNEELLNNWKRAAADFENFRKRTVAERAEILQHAKELTVLKLLPTLQSLEQVLLYAPDDPKYKDWLAGLKATIQQLEKTMEELGVAKIKTLGEQFDPLKHEAVEKQQVLKPEQVEKIIEEVSPGFSVNGKVIIPAKVIVGEIG